MRLERLCALLAVTVAATAVGAEAGVAHPSITDRQLAQRMTLRLSDFDSGWTRLAPAASGRVCRGSSLAQTAGASSPEFGSNFADAAANSVAVYATRRRAAAVFGTMLSAHVMSCYEQYLSHNGWSHVRQTASSFRPACAFPDHCSYTTRAWKVTGSLKSNTGGVYEGFVFELVSARRGRAVSLFSFLGYQRFTGSEKRLVDAAMRRGSDS